MPSLGDSVFIFVLALMLFGPKNLPKLARQLGKLMAEFRRASNEFRMQMEDELRVEEQKEHQAKVEAMPGPPSTLPDPEHPHLDQPVYPEPIAESGELKMMPPSTGRLSKVPPTARRRPPKRKQPFPNTPSCRPSPPPPA